ncbi:hypothetical protein FSP39_022873 [Pinctada imbricata]|uniref:Reverse transcriptase n=1 Tax=Pinctada imbricata TaxID=66713 RepID=A0AA88YI59_PINIB|nr:hypothetical protein FSP39_022873 [Pinctada imbricata]
MSYQLYNTLSKQSSLPLSSSTFGRFVIVANGDKVEIEGTTFVKIRTATGKHKIRVHVMQNTSHPLILGTDYLKRKNIVLNFIDNSVQLKNCSVKCKTSVELQGGTETIIFAKVPNSVRIGTQGVCYSDKHLTTQGLVVARCVVTVSVSKLIPVKILNTNTSAITLQKGKLVAKFTPLDNSYQISIPCKKEDIGVNKCCTMNCVKTCDKVEKESNVSDFESNVDDVVLKCTFNDCHASERNVELDTCYLNSEFYDSHLEFDDLHENVLNENVHVMKGVGTCNNVQKDVPDKGQKGKDDNFDQFLNNFDLDANNPHLSESEKLSLGKVLFNARDIFVTKDNPGLGFTTLVEHHIHLRPDAESKHQRPHRLPPDKREVLRHHLEELLSQGIIAPVSAKENVPITSPIVIVSKRRKSSGEFEPGTKEASLSSYRFCCDFRFLNSQTQQFRYSIPDLQELAESFTSRTPNYMSSIDLSSGFFQMGIAPESSKYTAFNTCFGTYKFLRLPMGLSTAPSSFQLLMDKVLTGLTFQSALCYLDDVVVASDTLESHLSDLKELFDRFRHAGLKLNPFKCKFAQTECIYLGHLVTKDGLSPPPDRIDAIKNYPIPSSAKQLRSFLGLMGWFRKYIPDFASIADPLYFLLKKGVQFRWSDEHQTSFDKLRDLLVNSPVLAYPNYDLKFRLAVDTSSRGIGFMLYQLHPSDNGTEDLRVIRFGSKGLSKWQRSYGPTKLELLGMTFAVLECASYLRGTHFTVECDHQALKPLFQKKLRGAIYERWLAILQEFNFDIEYKPAKEMVVADALSRNIQDDDIKFDSPDVDDAFFPYIAEKSGCINFPNGKPLSMDLLHPEVNRIQILRANIDDGYDADTDEDYMHTNRLPSKLKGIRHKRKTQNRDTAHSDRDTTIQHSGTDTTHSDRDTAHSDRDTTIQHSGTDTTHSDRDTAHSDRDTTIQHSGTDTTHSDRDTAHSDRDTTIQHSGTDTTHSDRDTAHSDRDTTIQHGDTNTTIQCNNDDTSSSAKENTFNHSDTDTSISQNDSQKEFPQSVIDIMSTTNLNLKDISRLQLLDPYYKHVIEYLMHDSLPQSQKLSRKILLEASDYLLADDLLYHSRIAKSKRSQGQSHYQLVIPESLVNTVLKLYHEIPISAHGGIVDTLDRIKEKYFFPKMAFLVSEFVKSCHECQNRKLTKMPTKSGIVSYPSPAQPFDVWQIDLQGPLPTSYRGNSYIFTATCMFSKLLFTVPIPNKDAVTVSEALFQLLTTYGSCNTILSDQGSEFIAQVTREVCTRMNITQQFTPAFAHHCLGACERMHRTLEERLTPFIDQHKRNWDDLLSSVTFAINQSVNSSAGYSPFEIVYGSRPKFPLLPSSRTTDLTSVPKDCQEYISKFSLRLEVIRQHVKDNMEASKAKMVQRANENVNSLALSAGDYVYLYTQPSGAAQKFQPKYSGPLIVHSVLSDHRILLMDQDHKIHGEPVHINRLKIAFVRAPTPSPYLTSKVKTSIDVHITTDNKCVQTDSSVPVTNLPLQVTPQVTPQRSQHLRSPSPRPKRIRRKPVRYRNSSHVSDISDINSLSDKGKFFKVKKVIGQRGSNSDKEYLIHYVGEPAQNAVWTKWVDLNDKLKRVVKSNPPPILK